LDALLPKEIGGRTIREHLDMMLLTYAFNLSSYPAISVPCGWTTDGLPVGLQIVGGWRQDAIVLEAAACFEKAAAWTDRRPPLN
jgi:Asp-tRNA(Asn)/Glu-tRNA(Gln) amidotransferase A subunit family amidase